MREHLAACRFCGNRREATGETILGFISANVKSLGAEVGSFHHTMLTHLEQDTYRWVLSELINILKMALMYGTIFKNVSGNVPPVLIKDKERPLGQ